MSQFRKENTRIFKNTLIIYVRMVFIILIGLLCTRYVLAALGKSDYGLYTVVGGLIAMLGFLSTAMSTTTRRFINIEMGKPDGNPNRIFNICLTVHIGLAVLILLFAEIIGMFYIHHWLNVDPGKMSDAIFVFQISTISACLGIINLPYQSLMESFERFFQTSMIDIVSNLFRLAMVILLLGYDGNGLRMYAVIMVAMTFMSMVLYHLYCHRYWPEIIRWRFQRGRETYREVIGFNNYTAISAAAYIARTQGSTLIVNFFFGTVVNSALSVAYQIENFSVTTMSRLTNAAAPQITQNYSGGNTDRSVDLVYKISRFSALLITMVVCCAYVEVDFVLGLWLKEVPEGAVLFTKWTLLSALVRSFTTGTSTLEQATGRIKWFQIWNSALSLACLPLGFIAYRIGAPVETIIQLYIGYSLVYRLVEFVLLRRLIGFDLRSYLTKSYIKPLIVVLIMAIFLLLYHKIVPQDIPAIGHISGIAVTFAAVVTVSFLVGMYPWERDSVKKLLINKFEKR